jgi:hypothetical protein
VSLAVIGIFVVLAALCFVCNETYRESLLQSIGSACTPEKRVELGEIRLPHFLSVFTFSFTISVSSHVPQNFSFFFLIIVVSS